MVYLDLLATAVFAFVGARALISSEKHFFAVALAAFITAIGGGTVRDFLLARGHIFWMEDTRYAALIVLGIALAYLLHRFAEPMSKLVAGLDSFSTTVFVLIGIQAAVAAQCPIVVVVLMGVLTGIGGGLIRDCLLTEKRLNLRSNRLVVDTLVIASAATLFSMAGVAEMTTLLVVASIQLSHAVLPVQSKPAKQVVVS